MVFSHSWQSPDGTRPFVCLHEMLVLEYAVESRSSWGLAREREGKMSPSPSWLLSRSPDLVRSNIQARPERGSNNSGASGVGPSLKTAHVFWIGNSFNRSNLEPRQGNCCCWDCYSHFPCPLRALPLKGLQLDARENFFHSSGCEWHSQESFRTLPSVRLIRKGRVSRTGVCRLTTGWNQKVKLGTLDVMVLRDEIVIWQPSPNPSLLVRSLGPSFYSTVNLGFLTQSGETELEGRYTRLYGRCSTDPHFVFFLWSFS